MNSLSLRVRLVYARWQVCLARGRVWVLRRRMRMMGVRERVQQMELPLFGEEG